MAINDRGQVVGGSSTASGDEHAFLWHAGTMIDIGPPEGSSRAIAINNRGQVLVWSWHIYLWERGSLTDLTPDVPPPQPPTVGGSPYLPILPVDINDRGQILTGVFDEATTGYQYGLWENGSLRMLPSIGGGRPFGSHLNGHGEVVGSDLTSAGGASHLVLWTPAPPRGRSGR
jgi:probable HAF family extracellular repeat protein